MSHHFDTKLSKEDPSLNVCDFYLFDGAPGTTVMAMTVNPDVGLSAPDTLHIEGLYAFRFDLSGDAREDVVFKFRFGAPRHGDGDEHRHIQSYEVRRATGEAIAGDAGELLIEGETGGTVSKSRVRAFVGIAPELFAGNAAGLHGFLVGFYEQHRCASDAFDNRQNFFARRNLTAIVLEVPSSMIGQGVVRAWATISLYGHAPEVQVSRWGLPLITHLFINEPGKAEMKERFNTSAPSDDVVVFSEAIGNFAGTMSSYALPGSDSAAYGRKMASLLCPTTLPYELGTPASFSAEKFNGRALGDDAMDVMLTRAAGVPLSDGVSPDISRIVGEFPYYGAPYSAEEQQDVKPVPRPAAKS
jgi:Domain of unknown function (DUF4331)